MAHRRCWPGVRHRPERCGVREGGGEGDVAPRGLSRRARVLRLGAHRRVAADRVEDRRWCARRYRDGVDRGELDSCRDRRTARTANDERHAATVVRGRVAMTFLYWYGGLFGVGVAALLVLWALGLIAIKQSTDH